MAAPQGGEAKLTEGSDPKHSRQGRPRNANTAETGSQLLYLGGKRHTRGNRTQELRLPRIGKSTTATQNGLDRYAIYLAPAGSVGIKAPSTALNSMKGSKTATKPRQRAQAPPNAAAVGTATSKQRPHTKNNSFKAASGQDI